MAENDGASVGDGLAATVVKRGAEREKRRSIDARIICERELTQLARRPWMRLHQRHKRRLISSTSAKSNERADTSKVTHSHPPVLRAASVQFKFPECVHANSWPCNCADEHWRAGGACQPS